MTNYPLRSGHIVSLDRLPVGMSAEVFSTSNDGADSKFLERIMEMGLIQGTRIEMAHHAPLGGSVAVRCRGSLIAIRKDNARWIQVKVL